MKLAPKAAGRRIRPAADQILLRDISGEKTVDFSPHFPPFRAWGEKYVISESEADLRGDLKGI